MVDELAAMENNQMWDPVQPSIEKRPVGCNWTYKTKFNSNRKINRYKADLVAKRSIRKKDIDYTKHLLILLN